MYDNWLKVRNHQPVEKLPTPRELAQRFTETRSKPKTGGMLSFYLIKDVTPLEPFKLRVEFESGQCKIVDVYTMRCDNPMFDTVWNDAAFKKVRFTANVVEWFRGLDGCEIEAQDLWGAGELCQDVWAAGDPC
jgi:hypothetical protein